MDILGDLKIKIKQLQDINNQDLIKYELYAIMTTFILSKEIFKNNNEVNNFLNQFGISFKDYVLKTRTLMLAKTLRFIEKGDVNSLELFKNILKDVYLKDTNYNTNSGQKNKKTSSDNYMNDILNKYSRNKNV